ncbi:glycosyltransferase, partial [Patescibacteria group bacterium]|nr:glycosyltransferase [Patescibacteria group bacterium]
EIVLINHNSTDATGEIARKYPVTVVDYEGPEGSVYARIKGFETVQGEYVLCIDGDSVAANNWVEVMTGMLAKDGMVMVGSWVRMTGTFYFLLGSCYWYFVCVSKGFRATDYLWGASLGLATRERDSIIKALKEGITLTSKLGLPCNPDDYWLALFMSQRGNLEVTNKTWVKAHAKESNSWQGFTRGIVARGIRRTIHRFLSREGLPNIEI